MMRREKDTSHQVWTGLIQIAEARSQFFGRHGERFDRRLYAEIESLIRIALKLRELAIINADPASFKKILEIQQQLLRVGQDEYLDFS